VSRHAQLHSGVSHTAYTRGLCVPLGNSCLLNWNPVQFSCASGLLWAVECDGPALPRLFHRWNGELQTSASFSGPADTPRRQGLRASHTLGQLRPPGVVYLRSPPAPPSARLAAPAVVTYCQAISQGLAAPPPPSSLFLAGLCCLPPLSLSPQMYTFCRLRSRGGGLPDRAGCSILQPGPHSITDRYAFHPPIRLVKQQK
jgi:hypothetical protein